LLDYEKTKLTDKEFEICISLLKLNQLKITQILKNRIQLTLEEKQFIESNINSIDKLLNSIEQ